MSITRQTIYASNCTSMESVNNPLIGYDIGMQVSGFFNNVPKSIGIAYSEDNIHIETGGIEKTIINGGALFSSNASKFLSMTSGWISLKISFPDYNIKNGVYKGLLGKNSTLEDHIIFGVNIGEHYISQPGIYAALTKKGIEFSIWTSSGVNTIINDNLNLNAGEDLILDFIWDSKGLSSKSENMRLSANGEILSKEAVLSNDSLLDVGGSNRPATFWLLDTPYKKSDLHAILRRIDIFSLVASPRANKSLNSNPVNSNLKYLTSGTASFNFDVIMSKGANVKINPPEFYRVAIENVDMRAIGPIGSTFHKNGQDSGIENQDNIIPKELVDLPPGFVIQREIDE